MLHFTRPPVSRRRQIEFYYAKTTAEFRADSYEDFANYVVRQQALHYNDEFWGGYPFQLLLNWIGQATANLPPAANVVEVGCGLARPLGELAEKRPDLSCAGFDFSYQLLKSAHAYWCSGSCARLGHPEREIPHPKPAGRLLANIQFGLARAADLPLTTGSVDLLISTFLLDRLADPLLNLAEWRRVLRPDRGRLLLISPLNFQRAAHWRIFHPPDRLSAVLAEEWTIIRRDELTLTEPLDAHGNSINWRCHAFELSRR